MTFLNLLEYIGTIAFAISGAMVGIENRMDIFGVVMLGLTTAVGGGILRDAILGIHPPTIFNNPITLILAFAFALACFMSKPRACFKKAELSIQIMDAIGLGIFTVVGVETTLAYNNFFLSVFIGTLTAVGGGALRDIFAHIDLAIFTRHFYACTAIIGSITSFFLFKINDNLSIIVTFFVIFTLRMLAIKYKWNLPKAK